MLAKCLAILTFVLVTVSAKEIENETKYIDYDEQCKTKLCIPRCCWEETYTYEQHKNCFTSKKNYTTKDFSDVPLFYNNLTRSGRYLKDVILVPGRFLDVNFNKTAIDYFLEKIQHNYYITEDGKLYDETPNIFNRWTIYAKNQYCVEYTLLKPELGVPYMALRFYVERKETDIPYIHSTADENLIVSGLLISCFFLTLVLVVYILLPELRNLKGKVLMAYVASLLFAFILLSAILKGRFPNIVCKLMTYCFHFLYLSSFCWMNVMSCDIWWTFRGYAKARAIHRLGENFKFCMYCCYGFGLPAAMNITMIVLNETDMRHVPWFVTPNIGRNSCLISGYEKLFYMYIPMLILIVCNWIFFLMTAFNIWRLHRATALLDTATSGTLTAHRSQKSRFFLYLKLSIIMGVNWLLDVVSSFYPKFKGWYIFDVYNMLTGLSIFLIFVCKKKILRKVYKRLCGYDDRKVHSLHSRSRSNSISTNTTESDASVEAPVCVDPKGPVFDKRC